MVYMNLANNIIAFDLDGTLLNSERTVSITDYNTLIKLGELNAVRIAATGRNFYSVNKVLPHNFPIDFVVFSSGAGIMNWRTKEIIYKLHITKSDILNVIDLIMPYELNFTIHKEIPYNHHMLLYSAHPNSDDLIAYTSYYKEFLSKIDLGNIPEKATQIIVLLNSHRKLFSYFKSEASALKCILTTSPINHKSMWMEVFHSDVSKSNGLKWLSKYLGLSNTQYFAIGNDFNDLDMLTFAHNSYVVANAPSELKLRFKVSSSNNSNGFTNAINNTFFND